MLVATTRPGRWSLFSFTAFGAFLSFFILAVRSGERGGDEFFDNLWLTVPFLAAYGAAVAGFVLGVIAIVARGERSVPVIVVSVVGLLITVFGVLEVLFPH